MKQMRRYWFLGVVVIMALLFAGMTFGADKQQRPSKDELMSKVFGRANAFTGTLPKVDPQSFKASKNLDRNAIEAMRSISKQQKGIPTPESLCDDGIYWMGGEAWTVDTDGTVWCGGAGGNLYFGYCNDTATVHEEWWGDIPLRVRIHNGIAYVFCYFYTYVLDVSDPTAPAFLSYGPGYYFGFIDAVPSPDDAYLILSAVWGDIYVFDLATMEYWWAVSNPWGSLYGTMYVPEDEHSMGKTLICGDWFMGYIDFYDISDLACAPPTYIGTIDDTIHPHNPIHPYGFNTGMVFYRYPYLYSSAEGWQTYHPYLFGMQPYGDTNTLGQWVSVYRLEDVSVPTNSYFVKEQTDKYDITRLGNSASPTQDAAVGGVFEANAQRRIALYEDQFANIIDDGYPNRTYDYFSDRVVYDGAFESGFGVAAMGSCGFRFFDNSFNETAHYWTGGFSCDVIPNGSYIFVPSGGAGLGILNNTDPTYPITWGSLEPGDYFEEVYFCAVSPDGNYAYVSDGSAFVWVVDCTDKQHPVIVSTLAPYETNTSALVTKLVMVGWDLVVGTADSFDVVDVVSNPAVPTTITSQLIAGGCYNVKTFDHPSYPDQLFIAAISPTTLYTFYYDGSALYDSGFLGGFVNLRDIVTIGQIAYLVDDLGWIYPVKMISQSPNIYFNLDQTGTTPVWVSYTWDSWPFYSPKLAVISSSMLACYGDDMVYGYPAVFLVSLNTPLAPVLMPATQPGVLPFDYLTGLNYFGNYVYYATDWFGIGALTLKPDFDMPWVVSVPTATVVVSTADLAPGHAPNPTYWIQGTVKVTTVVEDATSAITKVRVRYFDGSAWRTLKTFTTSTPAGTEGTYSFDWDTTKWIYGQGIGPIRVEVTDSGCNTYTEDSLETYAINLPPTYEIDWEAGCNEPPVGGLCATAGNWVVCGWLNFGIWGYTYWTGNEVPLAIAPIDDVSQIAYRVDDGAWQLFPVPNTLADGAAVSWLQLISIDTTLLADGPHTLYVRIADDCGLHGFEDIYGQSSWTFYVHNTPANVYVVAPQAGDLVRGAAIRVAATVSNELSTRPIYMVKFYVDDPNPSDQIEDGIYIGKSVAKDANGEWVMETTWDASSFTYGDHIMQAWGYEYSDTGCCEFVGRSPLVSFNLVSYAAMTVTATAAPQSGNAPLSTVLTASVTGGQSPYTYAWAFGDGQTGVGNVVSHTYTTGGNFAAIVSVTDNTGATATASVPIVVTTVATAPVINTASKATNPFRIHVYGSKFQAGCHVEINGVTVPLTTFKDSSHVVAKKGSALKAMCPKGVTVMITVVNPDSTVSNQFPYTR